MFLLLWAPPSEHGEVDLAIPIVQYSVYYQCCCHSIKCSNSLNCVLALQSSSITIQSMVGHFDPKVFVNCFIYFSVCLLLFVHSEYCSLFFQVFFHCK